MIPTWSSGPHLAAHGLEFPHGIRRYFAGLADLVGADKDLAECSRISNRSKA